MSDDKDDFAAAMKLEGLPRVDALGALGLAQVTTAIAYYEKRAPEMKSWAKRLRATALILGICASLVPLVVSMVFSLWMSDSAKEAKDWITLSAVLAVLAVGIAGFDRLFGVSNSWIRFITSSLDLQAKRTAFRIGWARQRVQCVNDVDDRKLLDALEYLETFLGGVDEIVRNETSAWVTEFRGALDELDKRISAQRDQFASAAAAIPDRGALELGVTNLDRLDGRAIVVQVNGGTEIQRTGTSPIVVRDLRPGIAHVTVRGAISQQAAAVERACTIEPGKVCRLDVEIR
jgi:hypothetical protein